MRAVWCTLLLTSALIGQDSAELDFLARQVDGRELGLMLRRTLRDKGAAQLKDREQSIARMSSAQDIFERRRLLRERMTRALGGLPERTPLNAQLVGVVDRAEYRIERVVFESQPKFYVTANLYLPKRGAAPYPAILFPLGHESPGGKAYPVWQQLLVSFAKKGYVALAWDTVGQGERGAMFDEMLGESRVGSTIEHTLAGTQCLLAGESVARYTIWDGMRALDYLLTRPEVDPKRIGITGNSGGGTHTAYLAALEDRIQVAAPSCYITDWRRLLETIGPQDAEQVIVPWLSEGLDHGDFVLAFAPRPYLILSAVRDFFAISGARSTFAESQRTYGLMGAADRVQMFEADDGHGYNKPRRLAAYRWFGKWLKGVEDDSAEPDVEILPEEELWATRTGQVASSLGGETVDTLVRKHLEEVRQPAASVDVVARLVGFARRQEALPVRQYGTLERSGYRIEKLVYETEPGIQVPALLYVPGGEGRHPAVVIAHSRGKAAAHAEADRRVRGGAVVLSIDARGFGETRPVGDNFAAAWSSWFGDYESAMMALLTGKSLVVLRAEDISRAVDVLAARAEVDASRITVHGVERAAVAALHAAAFDARIASVTVERMLLSYASVMRSRMHRQVADQVVYGALRSYDLPDLARWMGQRKVRVVDAVDPMQRPAPVHEVQALYPEAEVVRTAPARVTQ